MSVYFDFNATTPLAPSVINEITESLTYNWGNPSSGYGPGIGAKDAIAKARDQLAKMIGTKNTSDIIFTSGGTEANNMVIFGVEEYYKVWMKKSLAHPLLGNSKPHVITSNVEHDATILPLRHMEKRGIISLSVVPVSSDGCVKVLDVVKQIHPSTCLVSIMTANNETGVIMPIAEIGKQLSDVNSQRVTDGLPRVLFHTDAAQAVGKIPLSVDELGVDYMTIVGHKFYGPRIGALYTRGLKSNTTPLYPLLFGGGQEDGYRPGTVNTPMVAGLGEAASLVSQNLQQYQQHMAAMRDYLEQQLESTFPAVTFNCRSVSTPRLPNTCSAALPGPGPALLSRCPRLQASVAASCHAQIKPSPVLMRSGVGPVSAANTVRLSVGRDTTRQEVDVAVADLKKAVELYEAEQS